MIEYFGLCFCQRLRLLKVFGRPLRTMSLFDCCSFFYCVVLLYIVCLSVVLPCLANRRVYNVEVDLQCSL